MNVDTAINYLSLCSGAGGLDLGVGLAVPGARCVGYVEREAYAIEVLLSRMEDEGLDAAPVWTDLGTFDGRPWRGVVDGVVAGIPCQPHSVAGKRLGAGDERNLWPVAARIIGETQPAWVFLENVGGSAGFFCGTVGEELERMGYGVAAGLFTAAEVGASHKRERLFVLAYNPSIGSTGEGAARICNERERGNGYFECGGELGHPQGEPCGQGRAEYAGFVTGKPSQREGREDVERGSEELADAQEPGREGGEPAGGAWADGCVAEYGLPLFAPGPGDGRWGEIIERWPWLAPALSIEEERAAAEALGAPAQSYVRGKSDGLADRLDRLRLTGNGVVSLQAAFAFVVLAADLFAGGEG